MSAPRINRRQKCHVLIVKVVITFQAGVEDLEIALLKLLKWTNFSDKNKKIAKLFNKLQAGVGRFRNCIIKTVEMNQLQRQEELIQIALNTYVSLSFFWGIWHKFPLTPPIWAANLNEKNIWWVCLMNNYNYTSQWKDLQNSLLLSFYFLSFLNH